MLGRKPQRETSSSGILLESAIGDTFFLRARLLPSSPFTAICVLGVRKIVHLIMCGFGDRHKSNRSIAVTRSCSMIEPTVAVHKKVPLA